jgi:hypothetical protein
MMCCNGLCTSDQEWIKMKMKTLIHFDSKGNEVIAWCSFGIGSCLFLSNHNRCMCCHHRCSMHHICASWISNNNVHQSLEAISSDKNIHFLFDVAREKMGDLPLSIWFILQSNSCNSIPKCVMGCCMLTLVGALKQMGTQIINGMTTLTPWKVGNCRMWQTKTGM